MGQKVHPTGMRLGIVKDYSSRWYAEARDYADYLNNDIEVRNYLKFILLAPASLLVRRVRILKSCVLKSLR